MIAETANLTAGQRVVKQGNVATQMTKPTIKANGGSNEKPFCD